MRIRDRINTAACLTKNGIEWTSLKIRQDRAERHDQGSMPLLNENEDGATLANVELPTEVARKLEGDITASIRTSELIMRTMEVPSSNPAEIESMVSFQIDKISPFPLDQLAMAHEILRETENGALVLMAAAKRDRIDDIGEAFHQIGVHIHSIDARILGWLQLLREGNHTSGEGCEILLVADEIDFALAVLHDGIPLAFRSMESSLKDPKNAGRLAEEISYTLITLDAEQDLPELGAIDFWSLSPIPQDTLATVADKTGVEVRSHDLSILPPLSEGIVNRALDTDHRIELIPREWIEHKKRQQLHKRLIIATSIIAGIWLSSLLILFSVYKTRSVKYNRLVRQEQGLREQANTAIENRQKLRALQSYTVREDSALECLREVTIKLPIGDIEFSSFRYDKVRGVSLRGTAEAKDTVNEYFIALTRSDVFERLNNQRNETRSSRGTNRAVFSVNLPLPGQEESL